MVSLRVDLWKVVLNEAIGLKRLILDSLKEAKKKIILQSNNKAYTNLSNLYNTNIINLWKTLNQIELYKTKLE